MKFKQYVFSAFMGFATFFIFNKLGYREGTDFILSIIVSIVFSLVLLYIFADYMRDYRKKIDCFVKKKQENLLGKYEGRVWIETLFISGGDSLVAYILKKDTRIDEREEKEVAEYLHKAFCGVSGMRSIIVTSVNTFSDIPKARIAIKNAAL